MFCINKHPLALKTFPDGTSSFHFDTKKQRSNFIIEWRYDSDGECMVLWFLVHHIREHEPCAKIILDMPYLPNARMDRVKNPDEVFTLKWFSRFINSLCFDNVYITDPHSNVAAALINRVVCRDVSKTIDRVLVDLSMDDEIFCYPDEGAAKKYSDKIGGECITGIKRRDWKTGRIEGLRLDNAEIANGRDVLIIDDICSRGGTFMLTAKALKEAGAKNVFLYITHCENTIFEGEILKTDLISRVFTTDSIYRGQHEKITVV